MTTTKDNGGLDPGGEDGAPEKGAREREDGRSVRRERDPTGFWLGGLVVLLGSIGVWLVISEGLDVARLFVSGSTPLVVVALGYVLDRRLKEARIEREERQAERQRLYKERIEFTVDANFYGPKDDHVLAEFLVYVHNKSRVKHRSEEVTLRIRCLEESDSVAFREDEEVGRPGEVNFPHEPFDGNVIPERMRPIFVEPGVKQPITYVTRLDGAVEYVLANAKFNYIGKSEAEGYEPHTVERLFPVEPAADA